MRYDPATPVAVFLGPSLARHKAERILPANYYPPAAMGDIYRLLGTGVRLIVLIDGFFHGRTPVWQRELMSALDQGITVVGASSMGALRAAELDRLGMVGRGLIYAWYRSGLIDGDDEVALEHADEDLGWQALSEPLVNVRHNLQRAADESLLTAEETAGIIGELKACYFGQRSVQRLMSTAAVKTMPQAQRLDLADFLTDRSVNLKQNDALATLRWCADQGLAQRQTAVHQEGSSPASAWPRPSVSTVYGAFETLKRGLWREDGRLLPIQQVWDYLCAQPQQHAHELAPLVEQSAERFFLLKACDSVAVPPAATGAGSVALPLAVGAEETESQLRQRALTQRDVQTRTDDDRRITELLSRPPPEAAELSQARRKAVQVLAQRYGADQSAADQQRLLAALQRRAHAAAWIAHWAASLGIHVPAEGFQTFVSAWLQREALADRSQACELLQLAPEHFDGIWSEQAQYQWMLARGPNFFGFDSWSQAQGVMQHLQFSGEIDRWAAAAEQQDTSSTPAAQPEQEQRA